jgi:hypothetical protein
MCNFLKFYSAPELNLSFTTYLLTKKLLTYSLTNASADSETKPHSEANPSQWI